MLTNISVVDKKYNSYYHLVALLLKLNVITIKGEIVHKIPISAAMLGTIEPKGHWIELAVVSLSRDYAELDFGPRSK